MKPESTIDGTGSWLLSLPTGQVARQVAYDALWGIMHEADQGKAALADSLLSHANTREFGRYFSGTWLPCVQKWTLGRRNAGAGVTTNMHLEVFHSTSTWRDASPRAWTGEQVVYRK